MDSYKGKVLYVANIDWFFVSHRLQLSRYAKKSGYDITVASESSGASKKINTCGIKFVRIPLNRKGMNVFSELKTIWHIFVLFKNEKPDIVHSITIKPIMYGSIISIFFPNLKLINAVTGRGYVYSGERRINLLKYIINTLSRLVYNRDNISFIFQNDEDKNYYVNKKFIDEKRAHVIRGSGVNHNYYAPDEEFKIDKPAVLFASRLIKDKGIYEFVESSRIIKSKGYNIRFIVAGRIDHHNPNSISEEELQTWSEEGLIEWIGYQEDMLKLIRSVSVVVLPTYYPEGVPKILIEAASVAKPIITTNSPGCRDIVEDGKNGILIESRNTTQLCNAIIDLTGDIIKQKYFGREGRKKVLDKFTDEIVFKKTISLYDLVNRENS